MEGPFSNLEQPTNESEDKKPVEIKERLKKSSERIGEAEEVVIKRHIFNDLKELLPKFGMENVAEENLEDLSRDPEIRELFEKKYKLENQSQTTIGEGGHTNKKEAELINGQIASESERKLGFKEAA